MSFSYWLAIAAFTPLAAIAQERQGAADPDAVVAPARYESAFKNYRPFATGQQTPDAVWRAANKEVEELGGHVGHVRGSAQAAAPSRPAADAAPATPKPRSGHGDHH